MKEIEIGIPIKDDGTFDKKKQEEMAVQFSIVESALDRAINAKNESVELLKKVLGK